MAANRATDWAKLRRELLGDVAATVLPPNVTLPVLPESLMQFNRRSSDPKVSMSELAGILDRDTSLVCELLKAVNCSARGLRHKATTALQALTLLGVGRTRLLVLSAGLERYAAQGSSQALARRFARSNMERGLFARVVAEKIGSDPDLAFAAGLTQDFLLPVLARELHLFYSSTFERLATGGADLAERERAALGWDHSEAAGHVMFGWSFPDDLVCCVRLHHQLEVVVADERVARSAAAASALAAQLPDSIRQCPDGAERLATTAREHYSLDVVELAARVDQLMGEQMKPATGDVPLAARLKSAATVAV